MQQKKGFPIGKPFLCLLNFELVMDSVAGARTFTCAAINA